MTIQEQAEYCPGRGAEADESLVSASGLSKLYRVNPRYMGLRADQLRAVDGVDLRIARGETLGVVGESGSGKSTLGRLLLRLTEPSEGQIIFDGRDLLTASPGSLRALRREMQMIFQDPAGSLDPRMKVGSIIAEGLEIHGVGTARSRRDEVASILEKVGLHPDAARRYPHQFSGGQRQRIGIARALVLQPKFVVADEPVSALDVSVQAQVLNILVQMKKDFGLTYLFIAHNLAVVGYLSDRIAVMYLGKLVELAPTAALYQQPQHPYTIALLSAVLDPRPGRSVLRIPLKGELPTPINPPSGCRFRTRCPLAQEICGREEPPLSIRAGGHYAACHFSGEEVTRLMRDAIPEGHSLLGLGPAAGVAGRVKAEEPCTLRRSL
ncbi:MAG: ATP-binding cassette domain-containing protein [Anaerolineales bacterium]|nr:ATP-binding cassette domain-containing protein [Anaerolineales bacterium]